METTINQNEKGLLAAVIITAELLLNHWQGHRRVTRRVIEAFPEDKLFNYSIGGMRPFSEIVRELMGVTGIGVKGIATGDWTFTPDLDYRSANPAIATKEDILRIWDQVTEDIITYWPQIATKDHSEKTVLFGVYESTIADAILYFIDNEIHHRGQGYVYLRSLGIEPPAFWNRD